MMRKEESVRVIAFLGQRSYQVMDQEKKHRNWIVFSIRNKILMMSAVIVIPFLILLIYLLLSMNNYSKTYDDIVSNLSVANDYNLNFKEEMDESLYKLVVGYVAYDNLSKDASLKDPYVLIEELRSAFSNLASITTESESKVWLESLLRNIDTLEKRVDDILMNVTIGGQYEQNIQELDNNIYILTELIQDDIQYYIYYQTRSMAKINRMLNVQIRRFMIIFGIVIFFVLVVIMSTAIVLVSGILRPVTDLRVATEKAAEGEFSVRVETKSQDELAILSSRFNYLLENMQRLIDQNKEDERKMRKADLRLLQEQINPHFLYNTLDTIIWLIEADETEEAVKMIVTLSSFFRQVLNKGKEFVMIQEEQKHIESYLQIQEVRYRDVMEYDIEIDKVLDDYVIPKMTLQPIVENALYHGLKYKRAKGYIHINGEKDGQILRLTVRDNGVGMEEEELQQLREEIQRPCSETEKGFGLANVNERLRMYFGAQYGMTITSQKGKGTIVEIIIPALKEKTEE